MDTDLSLILGPIVLAVVVNVCPVRSARLPPLVHVLSLGGCVRDVHSPVVQLLYLRVSGPMVYPVRALVRYRVEGDAHEFPQTPCRVGLFLGYLPHGRGNVHVVGVRGPELWKARDLSSSALVSPPCPRRVGPER